MAFRNGIWDGQSVEYGIYDTSIPQISRPEFYLLYYFRLFIVIETEDRIYRTLNFAAHTICPYARTFNLASCTISKGRIRNLATQQSKEYR